MANPKITEELIEKWFGGINVRGWVMTIQGHPVFAIGKGPFNDRLLSEDAYDKHDNSTTAEHLIDLAYKKNYFFIGKGSKSTRTTVNRMVALYSPIMNWSFKRYNDSWKVGEKIGRSVAFKQMWERCINQAQSINTETDTKKGVAVKYIHEMFDPIYQSTKNRFKLTNDECLQAFEEQGKYYVDRKKKNEYAMEISGLRTLEFGY